MERSFKLDILGVDYDIVYKPDVFLYNELCHGTCSPSHCVIEINTNYSKEMQKRTLIHELLHAIAFGMSKKELFENEEVIDALTTGIYQVIKSNNLDLRKGL